MKHKIINFICLAICIMFISINFTGCNLLTKKSTRQTYAMGTIVSFDIYGKNGEKDIDACIDKLSEIENKMSANKYNSEINKISRASGEHSVKVSNETYYVIKEAIKYAKLSSGKFDITVEPLVKIWGIGTDKARIPKIEEIKNAMQYINYKNIELKPNNEVYLTKKGMKIDLGGIAKGYAADVLKDMLLKRGVKSAFINIGGNINLIGNKPNDVKWKIGIQNPLMDKGEYLGVITESNKSIVTSGNYERYFIKNGKRYHHIFDVHTGYPAEKGLISTTIISDKSIDGDALSTSTFVLGLKNGMKLIETLKGIDAIFVTKDKKVYITSGLKNNFKLMNNEFTLMN